MMFSDIAKCKNCKHFKKDCEIFNGLGGNGSLDPEANCSNFEEGKNEYVDDEEILKTEKEQVKIKFLDLVRDKKYADASEILVEFIKDTRKIFTTKDDLKSEVWIYKNGIYVPQGRSVIKEILRDLLGVWFNSYYYNLVLNKLEPDTYIDQDLFFNQDHKYCVAVENGILNIKTRKLEPFSPDKIFFNKLPVRYNKNKECPKVEEFLKGVLSHEEDRILFYELGGFCLMGEYKYERAFMFVGDGRNGKDKTLELIKRIIGVENCCSVALSSLVPESFILSEFFNKKVNLAGEINNKDLKDTSVFKSLTGRSIISAPRKFLKPITFQNSCKFVFACNELPMVYDNSRGFWDRWILLEFPYTFVPEQELNLNKDNPMLKLKDPSIIEKIVTEDELSGLLNKFLDGFDRLEANNEFSSTMGSEQIKELWIRKSNSVMAFCFDNIEEDYDGSISKKDFRKRYTEYCKNHKIKVKSDYVIKRTLEEMFGSTEGNSQVLNTWVRCWEGIKWKE